jgi:hypothetical protein
MLELAYFHCESNHFDRSHKGLLLYHSLVRYGESGAGRAHNKDCRAISPDPSLDFTLILWVSEVVLASGTGVTERNIDGPSPFEAMLRGGSAYSRRREYFADVIPVCVLLIS